MTTSIINVVELSTLPYLVVQDSEGNSVVTSTLITDKSPEEEVNEVEETLVFMRD